MSDDSRAPEVTVIDYGCGNLLSVQRALEYCGAKVLITSSPKDVLLAQRIVLPGVGAFSDAMSKLHSLNLVDAIQKCMNNRTHLMGICLGMQLLFDESEEFGLTRGLSLIPGRVVPMPKTSISGEKIKVPHIGWGKLSYSNLNTNWKNSCLERVSVEDAVYFVHSFMAIPEDPNTRIAETIFGGHKVLAAVKNGNIFGCQFHPEKSGDIGLNILKQFILQ